MPVSCNLARKLCMNYASKKYRINCLSLRYSSDSRAKVKARLARVPDIKTFLSNAGDGFHSRPVEDVMPPYMKDTSNYGKKVYFETYGCQMNVNDSEYAWAILKNKGYNRTDVMQEADVILLVTCSIREKAEEKIWSRLDHLKRLKDANERYGYPKVGVLGCMAERLKRKILEKQRAVDVIAGPDAYRDLPRLLQECSDSSNATINVMLSQDETYADIMPVRFDQKSKKAFVSIMRGCDNMCSYCIVPFTRGRERSRPVSSILEEIKILSDQGIKQVTLLGQNVNSYRDISELQYNTSSDPTPLSKGFKTIYKTKHGGMRFADLLDKVSLVDPEMRIRFTSPHPKDFPDEVIQIIKERHNICNQIHMPAQSGSSTILERMRRGYTRESYLELAEKIRKLIPNVCLSTDIISGFCGESLQDHKDTISLMEKVKYEMAFMFAYSMRQKTHAYHRMNDDIPSDVKLQRLNEVKDTFIRCLSAALPKNIGQSQLVLVEGFDKKDSSFMVGRNDGNLKVKFPTQEIHRYKDAENLKTVPEIGDYVMVKIIDSLVSSLVAAPVCVIGLSEFHNDFSVS